MTAPVGRAAAAVRKAARTPARRPDGDHYASFTPVRCSTAVTRAAKSSPP
jgi:hypothetical protein